MKSVGCLAALLICAGAAHADYSRINAPSGSELSHLQIINGVYGGGFTASGRDFNNAGTLVTFQRVRDYLAIPGGNPNGPQGDALNVHSALTSTMTDQVWQDGTIAVRAEAKYAGNTQAFGWMGSDDVNHNIFNVNGGNFSGGGPTATFTVGGDGLFRLTDDSGGTLWNSRELDNPVSTTRQDPDRGNAYRTDHMVTYQIIINNVATQRYLVFFEDQLNGDYDYNDLAVELSVVPLPPAAWAGIASLAGVGAFGYVRRRRNQR